MAAAALLAFAALPRAASAHALLVSSDPRSGTSVATAPTRITLTFSEPPDAGLSRVRLLDSSGAERDAEQPVVAESDPKTLEVGVASLEQGVYTVAWRTVSTADGHASAGSFSFGIGAGTVVGAPSQNDAGAATGSLAGSVARWLLYLGIAAMLGAALVGAALHPAPPPRLATLAAFGWVVAALGTIGVIVVQWLDSGSDLRGFWLSSLAIPGVARLAAAAASGAAVRLLPWARRPAYLVLLVAAGAALVVDVLAGHATAAAQPSLAIAVQSVHGLAALGWIGGLAALLVAIRGESTDEKIVAIRRYSTVAGLLLALVGVTGLLRAIEQIGSVSALIGTDFGRVALAKSAGLAALAGFGALNRFVNVPAVVRSFTGLQRTGAAEVLVGAGVILLSALLVNIAPPLRAGAASATSPIVAKGSDFGTSVRLQLNVTPGTPGFNTFAATVQDFDTHAPVAAASVSLRFTLVSQPGVGTSDLALAPTDPAAGTFAADGGNLSIDGIWDVTALVAAPGGAVEVPLALATRVPKQAVTADTSGSPTIYTVGLEGGKSAQVYVDPGRTGTNELHVTFFDAAGGALPVPTVSLVTVPADGASRLGEERELAPGHFVATVDLPPGEIEVDAVGLDPDGGQLHVSLVIEVTQ